MYSDNEKTGIWIIDDASGTVRNIIDKEETPDTDSTGVDKQSDLCYTGSESGFLIKDLGILEEEVDVAPFD